MSNCDRFKTRAIAKIGEQQKLIVELELALKNTEQRLHEMSTYCAELLQMLDAEYRKAPGVGDEL